jgi:hypothetical protein
MVVARVGRGQKENASSMVSNTPMEMSIPKTIANDVTHLCSPMAGCSALAVQAVTGTNCRVQVGRAMALAHAAGV